MYRSTNSFCLSLCIILSFLALSAPTSGAQPQAISAGTPPRIQLPIDPTKTVLLNKNVSPPALPQNDAGQVPPALKLGHLTILLKPSAQQQTELDDLLKQQQDPNSPNFHKWLSPEQYADRFGVNPGDVSKIVDWLKSLGFTSVTPARSRTFITFDGTADQVEKAFRTEIHYFEVDGVQHYSNNTEPSVPAALGDIVSGFRGLNDFRPRAMLRRSPQSSEGVLPAPSVSTGEMTPAALDAVYDIGALHSAGYTGRNQSIVIVGQASPPLSDLATFQSVFGLPSNAPQVILAGQAPSNPPTGDTLEADLDLEVVSAVAPNASIIFVYSQSAFDALTYAIDNNLAPVINISFGTCEPEAQTDLSSVQASVQQGNAQGITVLASAGDQGAAGCDYPQNGVTPAVASHGLVACRREFVTVQLSVKIRSK